MYHYYLMDYYQGRASYQDWKNKMRALDYECRKFLFEIGEYKPFKIN